LSTRLLWRQNRRRPVTHCVPWGRSDLELCSFSSRARATGVTVHCHLQALIYGCSQLAGRGADKAVYDTRSARSACDSVVREPSLVVCAWLQVSAGRPPSCARLLTVVQGPRFIWNARLGEWDACKAIIQELYRLIRGARSLGRAAAIHAIPLLIRGFDGGGSAPSPCSEADRCRITTPSWRR
jgi:hypothetical protein